MPIDHTPQHSTYFYEGHLQNKVSAKKITPPANMSQEFKKMWAENVHTSEAIHYLALESLNRFIQKYLSLHKERHAVYDTEFITRIFNLKTRLSKSTALPLSDWLGIFQQNIEMHLQDKAVWLKSSYNKEAHQLSTFVTAWTLVSLSLGLSLLPLAQQDATIYAHIGLFSGLLLVFTTLIQHPIIRKEKARAKLIYDLLSECILISPYPKGSPKKTQSHSKSQLLIDSTKTIRNHATCFKFKRLCSNQLQRYFKWGYRLYSKLSPNTPAKRNIHLIAETYMICYMYVSLISIALSIPLMIDAYAYFQITLNPLGLAMHLSIYCGLIGHLVINIYSVIRHFQAQFKDITHWKHMVKFQNYAKYYD